MVGNGLALGKSREKNAETATAFTQKAPVQTATAQTPTEEVKTEQVITPVVEPVKEPIQIQESVVESKYPWRDNTSMSEEELMFVKRKKSYDIPVELTMRLDYLKSKKKPKVFGQKVSEAQLILEALDEYTKREIKALGIIIK